MYLALYRKWRPQTFSDVRGQDHITAVLRNQAESGRISHAYLFCGSRGTGKTTTAKILAKAANCLDLQNGDPCNRCENCRAIDAGTTPDVLEIDAASNNSVENIRDLREEVIYPPSMLKKRVYIIDEVHMLSQAAFNAFLKTLEEPPAHAIFILATTEKHKILPTILSRCQIFDFKLISVEDIREHLARIAADQGVTADGESLHMIATKAEGALRDALSIYDRVVSFCGRELTGAKVAETLNVLDYQTYFDLTDAILGCDIPSAMLQFDKILRTGFDAQYMLSGLASHIRDLMVSKNPATVSLLTVPDDVKARYSQQASRLDCDAAVEALTILAQAQAEYRLSKNPRLLTEITLMRLASLGMDPSKKKALTL